MVTKEYELRLVVCVLGKLEMRITSVMLSLLPFILFFPIEI